MTPLPPLLQAFFTERLARQRDASPHTIAAYRDSFRLLLAFLHEQTGKSPSKLKLEDLDAARISAFLSHLEQDRGNSVRTRNARLTAIHSFFHYAALRAPEQAELIARVLAIPEKRFDTTVISYLTEPEIDALLAAPDRSPGPAGAITRCCCSQSRPGYARQSSRACAARTSSSTAPRGSDAEAKAGRRGAPRSAAQTRQVLHLWLRERGGHAASPLFPNRSGQHLTRGAIWRLVVKHAATASDQCPSLASKNITPHTLRHTTAMRLLHAPTPIDIATIALWLGHETLDTTNKYIHADMELKQRALDRTAPPNTKPGRYRPPDPLLAFLESL